MLKKTIMAFGLIAPLVCSVNVSAQDRSFGEIYTECGLGGMLGSAIDNQSAGQILAIISNVTWDLGTTAISSQISSPETCASSEGTVATYIHQAYDALEQDIASGEGEYLETLRALSNGDETFNASLRSQFALHAANPKFSEQTHYEKAQALFDIVTQQI